MLVYCLRSSCKRYTYVGATMKFERRIRQHNGELVGGAKYTKAHRPWHPIFHVHGFDSWQECLQFEWRWKHVRGRRRTRMPACQRRFENLCVLLKHRPWKERTGLLVVHYDALPTTAAQRLPNIPHVPFVSAHTLIDDPLQLMQLNREAGASPGCVAVLAGQEQNTTGSHDNETNKLTQTEPVLEVKDTGSCNENNA